MSTHSSFALAIGELRRAGCKKMERVRASQVRREVSQEPAPRLEQTQPLEREQA